MNSFKWSSCVQLCWKCEPKQYHFYFILEKATLLTKLLFYSLVEAYQITRKNSYTAEGQAVQILAGPLGSDCILKIEYEHTLQALKTAKDTTEWEHIRALKSHRYDVILPSIARILWLIVIY